MGRRGGTLLYFFPLLFENRVVRKASAVHICVWGMVVRLPGDTCITAGLHTLQGCPCDTPVGLITRSYPSPASPCQGEPQQGSTLYEDSGAGAFMSTTMLSVSLRARHGDRDTGQWGGPCPSCLSPTSGACLTLGSQCTLSGPLPVPQRQWLHF